MFILPKYTFLCLVALLLSGAVMSQALDFRYEQFDTDDGLPSSELYDIHEDTIGNIWLATDRGVVKYDGYEFITYDTSTGLANLVNFGFQSFDDGTFLVNGLDGSFSFWNGHFFEPFAFNKALKSLKLNEKSWFDFLGRSQNTLFFQTISPSSTEIIFPVFSVNICDGKIARHNEGFWRFLADSKGDDQLIRRRINIIRNNKAIEDSTTKYDKTSISEIHFQWDSSQQIKRTRFIGTTIVGIHIDKDDGEWIITKSGILYFKNGDLSLQPKLFFKGTSVSSINESRDGALWITTTDNGLFYIPNRNIKQYRPSGWVEGEAIYKFKKNENYLLGLSEKSKVFFLDKNQLESSNTNSDIFFSSNSLKNKTVNSRSKFSKKDFGLIPLENESFLKYSSLGFGIIPNMDAKFDPKYKFRTLSATRDSKDILWIGTTVGLFKWMPNYNDTLPEAMPLQENKQLRINYLEADRNGIWIATPKHGLIYKNESAEVVLKHDRLRTKILHCIFKQDDTTLWVGSNRGLFKIKYKIEQDIPIIEKLELFTTADGLVSNFINDVTFWNGEIWVVTDEGFCHFKPYELSSITTAPSLQINSLEAKKRKVEILNPVTLNHDENDVSITYTGISHNKPRRGFYHYKINDKPWVSTNERKVSFLDLNQGEYTFLVKSRSDSGIWSNTESLTFIIKPHLFEKLWFRVLITLTLCVIAFMFIIRSRKSWKKKMESDYRLRRAELTTLRNQMNPHFMFNSLTSIQGLIYKGEKHEASNYIGDFSNLMRKSLEYSKLENISLNEEIEFIENYLELEKKRFKNLFEYQIIVDPGLNKNFMMPPLLLQPLLENAIKHGLRRINKKGRIEITFKKHDMNEVFEVTIQDNGIGMDVTEISKSKKSMGLGIVKDRINLIRDNTNIDGVSFDIESEIGEGTKITLLLPLNS